MSILFDSQCKPHRHGSLLHGEVSSRVSSGFLGLREELLPEAIPDQQEGVPDDHEHRLRPRHGHVEALAVGEESKACRNRVF